MKTIIQHGFSRRWLGAGLSLVAALAAQASTDVAFQIDMASVSPAPTSVYISGSFNGWPGFTAGAGSISPTNLLVNVSGTIWSNTFTIGDASGTVESCKFQYEAGDNWESINNRQFILGTGTQELPLETWNVNDWPTPTNQVTFQVDLSAQTILGQFTPGQTVSVAGDFENWDNAPTPGPFYLTNNPTLPDASSNIYSGTFPVPGFPPTTINYKFRANGGWESPVSTGGNNRQATVSSASQVLPLVFYNDNGPYDLVLSDTTVTFTLYLPDGTPDNGGVPFAKGVDSVYINGDFLGWWSWNTGLGGAETGSDQMTNVPGTDIYQQSFVIPRGNSLYLNYDYSVDGFNDENGFQTNHIREIRAFGSTYKFPTDQWSWTVAHNTTNSIMTPGTNGIVELDYGYLSAGAPAGGKLPVTWWGRPGVVLQNRSALNSGAWNDNNLTDGAMATNWPVAGASQFFHLKKK